MDSIRNRFLRNWSDADWEKCKPLFTQLYVNENRPLPEVMRVFREEHGLPTEKTFKNKIKTWNLRKYLKDDEARLIVDGANRSFNDTKEDEEDEEDARLRAERALKRKRARQRAQATPLSPESMPHQSGHRSIDPDLSNHLPQDAVDPAQPSYKAYVPANQMPSDELWGQHSNHRNRSSTPVSSLLPRPQNMSDSISQGLFETDLPKVDLQTLRSNLDQCISQHERALESERRQWLHKQKFYLQYIQQLQSHLEDDIQTKAFEAAQLRHAKEEQKSTVRDLEWKANQHDLTGTDVDTFLKRISNNEDNVFNTGGLHVGDPWRGREVVTPVDREDAIEAKKPGTAEPQMNIDLPKIKSNNLKLHMQDQASSMATPFQTSVDVSSPRKASMAQDLANSRAIATHIWLEIGAFVIEQDLCLAKDVPRVSAEDIHRSFKSFLQSLDFTRPDWTETVKKMKDELSSKDSRFKIHQSRNNRTRADISNLDDLNSRANSSGHFERLQTKLNTDNSSQKMDYVRDSETIEDQMDCNDNTASAGQVFPVEPSTSGLTSAKRTGGETQHNNEPDRNAITTPFQHPFKEELQDFGASPEDLKDLPLESSDEESFVFGADSPSLLGPVAWAHIDTLVSTMGPELVREFLSTTPGIVTYTPQSSQETSTGSNVGNSSSPEVRPLTVKAVVTNRSLGKGRLRQNEDEEDDEEAPRRKRPRQGEPANKGQDLHPLLACPFAKFDPARYSEQNCNPREQTYRRCTATRLTSIARLKQHLYRVHSRPPHFCSSCFTTFESEDEQETHERKRPPCEVKECPFQEKMTSRQYGEVKRRRVGESHQRAWFVIFGILFPNVPETQLPDSPYVGGANSAAVIQATRRFMEFLQSRLPQRAFGAMVGTLFGDSTPPYQYFFNQVLEETLPTILEELYGQYGGLEPEPEPELSETDAEAS